MSTIGPRASLGMRLPSRPIRPLVGAAVLAWVFSLPAAAAWLGVSVQELTPTLVEAMELHTTSGVLVTDVVPGSPADLCGLRTRDVIVEAGGSAVEHPSDLVNLIDEKEPGDRIAIQIRRGSSPIDLDAELAAPRSSWGDRPRAEVDRDRPAGRDRVNPPGAAMSGPQIGIDVYPLSDDLAHALHVDRAGGLLVLRVRDDSPAAKAGVRAGDVILRMNDREVRQATDVREALASRQGSEGWTAELLRDGKPVTIEGRIDPAWRLPEPASSYRMPDLPDRREMSVWTNRQWQRLDREIQQLRDRVADLEHRLREKEGR